MIKIIKKFQDEEINKDTFTCCICGKEFDIKQANNAEPLKDGKCCEECNVREVIPYRIKQLKGGNK